MSNRTLWLIAIFVTGIGPFGDGLRYFISGDSYRDAFGGNMAVAGQIIFALGVIGYCIWRLRDRSIESKG